MTAGADGVARERAGRQAVRPALFLDRDGTLVEEVPYLHDPERVVLLTGVGALAAAGAAGYALVVVTNQAGVRLDAILPCPPHPRGTVPGYARACRCRKPGPGMLEAAAERLDLDLPASFLVGNHPTDVGAAVAAGATPLFVATGRAAGSPPPPGVASFADLEAATRAVLRRHPDTPGHAGPAGMQKARPAPAVTGRTWPGMPVGRGRARP